MKVKPNNLVMQQLSKYSACCAISSVTLHELSFGIERLPEGRRKTRLLAYLSTVVQASLPIIEYDAAAALFHSKARLSRQQLGRPLHFADGQIAGTALAQQLTLVTANTKDFELIAGLQLENWHCLT